MESTISFILVNCNWLTITQFLSFFYFHLLSLLKYSANFFVLFQGFLFNILRLLRTLILKLIRLCHFLKENFSLFTLASIVQSSLESLLWMSKRIRMLDFCNQAILFLVIFLVISIDGQRYPLLHIILLLLHLHKMVSVQFLIKKKQMNLYLLLAVNFLFLI